MKEWPGSKDSVDVDVNRPEILCPLSSQPAVDLYPDGPFCVTRREKALKRVDRGWIDDLLICLEDGRSVGLGV